MNLQVIQDTLYDWIVGVHSTMPVLWRNQEVPQSTFPYANLWIRGISSWSDNDAKTHDFDEDRTAGEEIHRTAAGPRQFHVDLDVWSRATGPDAVELGEQILDALQSDATRAILSAGGVSFLRTLMRHQKSQVEGEARISHFYAEVLFCAVSSRVEKLGYIASVVVSSDPTNVPDFDITQTIALPD